jgi:exonuclease I
MEAVASNSSVSFEYLKANISRVPLSAMSYNSNVPLAWHKENINHIVWHSLCMKLSKL